MKTYLALFILALGLSYAVTPLVRSLAIRWGILDRPGQGPKIHERPIPRLGGLAIYAAFLLALSGLFVVENRVTVHFREQLPQILKILGPSTLILLLGLYDDVRGANARIKFSVQAMAAVLLYISGIQITRMWNPWGGTIELGLLSLPLTLLWLMGITNAFNLLDGLDGLSAGAALFATLTLLVAALFYQQPLLILLTLALAGAIAGFLRYNFAPATIFLGDSGSLFLGFLLGALAIESSQKSTTAIAVAIPVVSFGLPIVDTLWTLIRRALSRRPLFQGDLEHIHHMLLRRGWTRRRVVLSLYAACAACGLFSLLFVNPQGKPIGLLLFILGVSVLIFIQSLGYPEAQELQHALGRALCRPRALTRNIQWRRVIAELHHAGSFGEIDAALARMLEIGRIQVAEIRWTGPPMWHKVIAPSRSAASDGLAPVWSVRIPLTNAREEKRGEFRFQSTFAESDLVVAPHLLELLQQALTEALERASRRETSVAPLSSHSSGISHAGAPEDSRQRLDTIPR
jgi:UDP-GlcNAc:undecaprenyl-phosphate GlcNAc-1-phosphate transferase